MFKLKEETKGTFSFMDLLKISLTKDQKQCLGKWLNNSLTRAYLDGKLDGLNRATQIIFEK